jgi:hypothetical protein
MMDEMAPGAGNHRKDFQDLKSEMRMILEEIRDSLRGNGRRNGRE